jgi:hypothetical protein
LGLPNLLSFGCFLSFLLLLFSLLLFLFLGYFLLTLAFFLGFIDELIELAAHFAGVHFCAVEEGADGTVPGGLLLYFFLLLLRNDLLDHVKSRGD